MTHTNRVESSLQVMYVPGKSSSLSIRRIKYQRYQFLIFVDQSESTFKQKKNKKKIKSSGILQPWAKSIRILVAYKIRPWKVIWHKKKIHLCTPFTCWVIIQWEGGWSVSQGGLGEGIKLSWST